MHLEETIVIKRPPETIWAFWADPFNIPRLRGGSLAYRQTSPGPLGIGSTAEGRAMFLGFEIRVSFRITEFDPPRRGTATFAARPLRSYVVRTTLEPVADGTRVVRSSEVELHPALKPLTPVLGLVLRRVDRRVLQNLKRTLEAEPG